MKKRRCFSVACLAILLCGISIFGAACSPPPKVNQNTTSTTNSESVSPFGLYPEKDPIIYTTESGLDIKFGGGTLSNGSLSGYTYVTMANRNWVIIGRSTSFGKFNLWTYAQKLAKPNDSIYADNTVAGNAIWNDNITKDPIQGNYSISGTLTISSKEVANGEIPSGCVLVISENNITTSTFTSLAFENLGTNYNGSVDYSSNVCSLRTLINGYCTSSGSSLGFTSAERALIKHQTLKTTYINTSKTTVTTTLSTQYLFPLATGSTSQNFRIETYLSNDALRKINNNYWLRTGENAYSSNMFYSRVYYVTGSGGFTHYTSSSKYGVRPAFVLSLA